MSEFDENRLNDELLALKGEEAARAWQLCHSLDLELEACQRQGNSAKLTLEVILPWLKEYLSCDEVALKLFVSKKEELYIPEPSIAPRLGTLLEEERVGEFEKGTLACVSLEVLDETVAYLAASFSIAPPSPGAAVLLKIAAQEMDNLLYEFRRARLRHEQVMEIERRLTDPILSKTIDSTADFVLSESGAIGLVVAFQEDTLNLGDGMRCSVHFSDGRVERYSGGDGSELGERLQNGKGSPDDIAISAGLKGVSAVRVDVETGLSSRGAQGFVIASADSKSWDDASRELLQHFAIALGQRLVDYHKEQRYLSQFFSPGVCSRLLSSSAYQMEYLLPRLRDVAILFSDITSFTCISEQILDGPEEVGELVDYWSQGVVEILYKYGGTFDKMVGDCVIGLFGPPFDERALANCCEDALNCALDINRYTAELRGIDSIEKIVRSDLIPGLGVATGVHCGAAMVGAMGPNRDFTAFGREMNNTARLQGIASFREILVMEEVKKVLFDNGSPLAEKIQWGEVSSEAVKNVKDPLRFYRISL